MMKGPSRQTERKTIGVVFLAVLATIGAVLPIVVAIILSNLWEKEIISSDISIQFIVLVVGLFILIAIDIFMTVRTVGLRRFEPK